MHFLLMKVNIALKSINAHKKTDFTSNFPGISNVCTSVPGKTGLIYE